MFFPLGDDSTTSRKPIVNYSLIAINVIAFLATGLSSDPDSSIRWEMVPAEFHWPTIITSMFLHGGWAHLIGNMWFLWIFGKNVEDRLGHIGYAIFYFVCGLAAGASHLITNAHSQIPTLGASGAIAGVMGAYICFFPHQRVRTLVFLGIFVDFWRIPAFVWIGLWFVEQLFLGLHGLAGPRADEGGIAYAAHIGGFLAGVGIGGAVRALRERWSRTGPAAHPMDARPAERRPFLTIPEDSGIEFMDEPSDGYSVLRLSDDPPDLATIARAASAVTGEPPSEVARRLEATRGMIARALPRDAAGRLQRELHVLGIPSAIILHNRSNFPPRAVPVEGASWDDRALRVRAGDQIVLLPWGAPFLYIGARVDGRPLIDLFVSRKVAYRISGSRAVPLTEVDPQSRSEISMDLGGFAEAVLQRGQPASVNEGVRSAAQGTDWGRLDFVQVSDYDDYVFWLYNLILAQSART